MKATVDNAGAAVRSDARFCFARMPDGTRLRYFRQGPPDAPAILMLHGLSDSSFSFSRILPLVPPQFQAIALDQRGHGESDRPAAGYDLTGLASDAIHVLDAAQVHQAVVVGHSMGTFVARTMAALAPDRVASLVLIDPGPLGVNPVLDELWNYVSQMSDPVDPAFVREFQESCIRRPVPAEFMDLVVQESLKLPPAVWRAALAGMMAYEPVEGRITCPTLVVGGEADAVFSVEEMTAVASGIKAARVRILEGIGHTPHWEDPRTAIAILLDEVAATRPT
jgi:non-heme chloroperoxidase